MLLVNPHFLSEKCSLENFGAAVTLLLMFSFEILYFDVNEQKKEAVSILVLRLQTKTQKDWKTSSKGTFLL